MSLLMEHMIGLTDTAYLGRVGEVELGASALAGVYYLVIYMLGFGFSIGAQVLIARRNGAQEYKRIGPVFLQGTFFLLLLASLLFTASHLYSPFFLRKLIGSDDVYQATMKYVDWRVYGFFFSFVAVMFRAFYVGITKTKILTINSVVMVLANVMLNYVLIFGKFGFPALGIAGAAIASLISEAVSVLFFILYTWKKVNYKKYGLFEYSGIDFRMLRQDIGCFYLDYDSARDCFFRLVRVLCRDGASGRAAVGDYECGAKHFFVSVYVCQCLCFDLQFAGQQSDWCWKAGTGDGIVRAYDTDLLLLRFAARYSDCPIPGTGIAHLHG